MTEIPDVETPRPACPVCKRPSGDESREACSACLDRVARMLNDLLTLHTLACVPCVAVPGTKGSGSIGAVHRDPPLPLDLEILDLAHGESLLAGMRADEMGLEDWAIDWRHFSGHSSHGAATERDRSRTDTLSSVIRYLGAQWPLMARSVADGGHPAADEFADDVKRMHRRAESALGLGRADGPAFYIPCPADLDTGARCGYRLGVHRQPLPLDGQRPLPVALTCPRCGSHWDAERLMLVAVADGARVELTVDEAALHFGVSTRTVRRMVERGDLRRGRWGRVITGKRAEAATSA